MADYLREGTEDEFTVKWTAASMSAAGPDTVRIRESMMLSHSFLDYLIPDCLDRLCILQGHGDVS